VLILTVLQGPDKGRKFELPDHEPQFIGRSTEALPLNDISVSRRHAELTPDAGVWFIRDLESQNGTYVNGVRIYERIRLRPGDQVRTGQTLFVFGATDSSDPDVVRVLGPSAIDATVERTLPLPNNPNEDSMILAVPDPNAAAAEHLKVIYKLTSILVERALDRGDLLRAVLGLAFAEFNPDRGCVMVIEPTPEAGQPIAPDAQVLPLAIKYREAPLDKQDARINLSRTILQHALRTGEGVLSSNAMTDPRFAKGDSVQRLHIRSAMCAPIRFRDRTFGAIYVDSSISNYTFTQDQLALLNAIASHAAMALANAELYQQALQTERLAVMGETVATLSHSIKNILQGLRGGADVVEMGLRKDDLKVAKGGWPILKRNLDRIIALTMNMLAFSRHRVIEPTMTPLGPMLEDCASLLEALCAQRQVALIVDADAELPPVPLDQPLIHQALMNLLTNAIEAAPSGTGAVTVRAVYWPLGRIPHLQHLLTQGAQGQGGSSANAEPKPLVEVAVIDNGPGIPRSKQPWVFQPFNTTKGLKGTGLGLAVAKRIIEEHRGRLFLESDEGQGATFRIVLSADAGPGMDPHATH
jgi:two-component system NtrC family sensor kinase